MYKIYNYGKNNKIKKNEIQCRVGILEGIKIKLRIIKEIIRFKYYNLLIIDKN